MFPSAKPPQNMRLRASSGRIGLASKSLHYIASHPTSYFYPAHSLFFHSAPGRIRTCDRRIRSPYEHLQACPAVLENLACRGRKPVEEPREFPASFSPVLLLLLPYCCHAGKLYSAVRTE